MADMHFDMPFTVLTKRNKLGEKRRLEQREAFRKVIEYIKENTKDNPQGIWETNIFGKTVEQIVSDGIKEKTHNITPESMEKISGTLEKVMNENTGLVCLIV